MRIRFSLLALLTATFTAACDPIAAPEVEPIGPSGLAVAQAAPHINANGTFTQTGITSLQPRSAGPNTILDQTSVGTVSGTLSGTYSDELRVVIHPEGNFNAHFTITCDCTVNGKTGTLELVASDNGQLVSPTMATFAGRAVITSGSGELSGMQGVLQIQGSVDLATGLSTYTYSGSLVQP